MLYVEKKNDVKTLSNMGASRNLLFKIFFFEGLLIAGKGILIGGVLGYAICAVQLNWSILTMPNTGGEVFRIALSFKDGLFIFSLVSVLSVIFSYLPVRYLLRNNSDLSSKLTSTTGPITCEILPVIFDIVVFFIRINSSISGAKISHSF